MTVKPLFHVPTLQSSQSPYFTHLLLVRNLLAFLLLLAVLPQLTSPYLVRAASLIQPLLLIISGFTLVYATPPLSAPTTTLYYLRRLSTILPLYIALTFIHAAFFSTSTSPFTRAFFQSLCLTPFLPYSLAFPQTDAPILAQTLVPSIIFFYLIFPTLRSLLPQPNPRNRTNIIALIFAVCLVTLMQAFWLTHLPFATSANRAFMLFDFAAVPVFLTYFPSFFIGVLLALLHQSQTQRSSNPTLFIHNIFVASFSSIIFLVLSRFALNATENYSMMSVALNTGLLHPFFAIFVFALANLSPHTPSLSRHFSTTSTGLSLTIFLLALPLQRALSSTLCRTPHLDWFNTFCVAAANASYLADDEHTYLQQASHRLLHLSPLSGDSIRLSLYLPCLLLLAAAIYPIFVKPIVKNSQSLYSRLVLLAEDGRLNPPILSNFIRYLNSFPNHPSPNRSLSQSTRFFRILVYYIASAAFLYFVFTYSLPISLHVRQSVPTSFMCWLPDYVYNCDPYPEPDGFMGKHEMDSPLLTTIVDYFRWCSLLILPTMCLNIVGQAIFPRAVWRSLPTISQMLASSTSSLAQTSSNSNHPNLSLDFILHFRYVTRGNHPHLVTSNAQRARDVLENSGLPSSMWRVEVVTDNRMYLTTSIADPNVSEIVVPDEYSTSRGSLFKARALNYAIASSRAGERDWIIHLDEETRFDEDTVRAILHHCGVESYRTFVEGSQQWPRIGQGPIVFGRALTDHRLSTTDDCAGNWMTSLADSGRVDDDCGRFRMQYECGEAWVGMHGSFVVCCNNVEREVTYDHGMRGSIAEDAFFALIARKKGVRFRWVDGLMYEQSPFEVMDFLKQRARWMVGVGLVVTDARIPYHLRVIMGSMTFVWSLMPIIYLSFVFSILYGSDTGGGGFFYHNFLVPMLASVSLWHYLFGYLVTFSIRQLGVVRFLVLLYAQLLLSPVWGLMEVASVIYGLTHLSTVSQAFHIVKKELPPDENVTSSDKVGEHSSLV